MPATELVDENGSAIGGQRGDIYGNAFVKPVVAPTGVPQNRNIPSVLQVHPGTDATNVATWTAGELIKHVVIPPNMRYIINHVGGAASAKTAIEAAGGIATTVTYGRTYTESLEYAQAAAITRLDLASVSGSDETEVEIEAWADA